MKMVGASDDCSAATAGGAAEVTDLGPDDASDETSATASFTFTIAGSYKVCYKVAGGSWAQVGTGTVATKPVTYNSVALAVLRTLTMPKWQVQCSTGRMVSPPGQYWSVAGAACEPCPVCASEAESRVWCGWQGGHEASTGLCSTVSICLLILAL